MIAGFRKNITGLYVDFNQSLIILLRDKWLLPGLEFKIS